MGTIETLLRVKADASQAVSGLKPLQTTLDQTASSAKTTEAALNGLDGTHKISLNDEAIQNAQAEILRLRTSMRDQLAVDINADTRPAQTRIRQLQSSIKTLEQEKPEVEVAVNVDQSKLVALQGTFSAIKSGVGSGLGSGLGSALGPLAGQLFKVGTAGTAAGEGGAAAAEGIGAAGAAGLGAATGIGLVAVALAAAAKVAWDFGQAAADVQTSVTQIQALTGDKQVGTQLFEDLQKWAATTPFAIDDATEAAKKLLAAGVKVKDVNSQLNDMGNIASATGVPLAQIATVFAQMESKGKATFEELQQLAEAGVPVWQRLADKMHLSVAEVQKLATEGKLNADAIDLVRESVAQMFPTAMADQAATFNGQMSTFKDTLDQTEQSLGTLFLPLMTGLLDAFNKILGPILAGAQALASFNDQLEQKTGVNILEAFSPALVAIDALNGGLKDNEDQSSHTAKAQDDLKDIIAKVQAGMDDGSDAAKQYAADLKVLEDQVTATTDALGNIGVNIRTKVSFIINQDDLREEIEKSITGVKAVAAVEAKKGPNGHPAIEGVEGIPPVELPANLNINQISGLGDKQQELVGNLADFAAAGLEEGARRAKLDPNFDVRSFDLKVRRETGQLLIQAGVDPEQVNRVLDRVIGIPRTAIITAALNSEKAQRQLFKFTHPHYVPVVPFIDEKTAKQHAKASGLFTSILTGGSVDGKKAPVTPEVDPKAETKSRGTLDDIAKPGGVARPAPLKPTVDSSSLRSLRQILKSLSDPVTKTIYLKSVPVGPGAGGPGRDNPDLVRNGRNLAPSSTATPSRDSRTSSAQTVTLAPRSTPVKVYLDGEEIATKTVTRIAANQPTTTLRRTA